MPILSACAFLACLFLAGGCFKISINPTCPAEISVGDTGDLAANEVDPGAIPTYLWEAFPTAAVQIADSAVPTTTFEAMANGEVTFRLTASDGLFQVVDTCRTQIATAPVSVTVTLVAAPPRLAQGESTLLTCTSAGATPAVSFVVDQLDGPLAELTTVAPGVAVGILNVAGDAVFRCIGTDANGNPSDPALVTVTVTRPSRPGGGVR
ncbi:MAG: hypothetical protein Q7R41_18595 [Phycisphaerales bacterium]|nr:hypothetical protein [Phycisphaerales bacterium]